MTATRRGLLMTPLGFSPPLIRLAAAARRSLTFSAFGGLFQEVYESAIVEPFAATHPETGVFYYPVSSSSQTLAVLRRQRDQPELDVVLLDAGTARIATAEGLLEPLIQASMPVLGDLGPGCVASGVAGPMLFSDPLVLLFDAAKPRPPPLWKLLWGRFGARALAIPAAPDAVGVAFSVVAGQLFGGGEPRRMIEAGLTAIARLAPNVASWEPRPDVYHFVGDGGARYGVGWNGAAQIWSGRLDGRLGVAFPEEGTLSRVITINLVKGSRQPDAARQFIAHLLGPEAQKTMVERMFLGPANAKALYPEAALLRTASIPARAARAMPADWTFINASRDSITARWRDLVPPAG